MSFSLKKLIGGNVTKAQVVDDHLVLSLLHAQEPKIWRMALDKIGTASFEIKTDSNSNVTKLILKPKKGTAEIIAAFENKKIAIDALTAASSALQNQSAQVTTKNTEQKRTKAKQESETGAQKIIYTDQPPSKANEAQKWLIALMGAIIVVGLYMYLTSLIPETNVEFQGQTARAVATDPQSSTGVPVSADDFLGGL